MDSSELSILVVGAGAIGGITAAILKNSGLDVGIVCKYEEYATRISEVGIEIAGKCGNMTVKMPAYARADDVKEQKDLVLLATKATDMLTASKEILPLLRTNGFVISMQNGICEDAIASVVGRDRVIGCVTGWGATMEPSGKLVMTSTGEFIIGYPGRQPDDYLVSVAKILSAVVPVKTTGNIMGHLYSKLIINSCITSLGAISGLYLGRMLYKIKLRRIFMEIVREAMDVADIMGIKVEIFGGRLDFEIFRNTSSGPSLLRCHLLLLIIGYRYRRLKSSSLQSLERGKPTEIEYLNGYIVEHGKKSGLKVPVNTFIVGIIHDIEQNRRKTGMHNFDDPFFDRFD